MSHIQHSVLIPVHRNDLFEFISDYKKRVRLLPPDILLELTSIPSDLKNNANYDFKMNRFGLSYSFSLNIENINLRVGFTEKTHGGIFSSWSNTFQLEEQKNNSTLLTNIIEYKLMFGVLGTLVDDLWLKNDMKRILQFSQTKLLSFFE